MYVPLVPVIQMQRMEVFLKKQSWNSEFHAQAIIMYQSFFRGSAKFGGQKVNEIHVNKQKRDDRFVPPCP